MTPQDHVGDDPVPHAGAGSQGLSTARLTGLLNTTYGQLTDILPPTLRVPAFSQVARSLST